MNPILLDRITFDKQVLCGKPIIRGMRISVEMILDHLAKGVSEEEILEEFPLLEKEDIRAALHYATSLLAGEEVHDRSAA
jgi:uncharacterized protein (DUF433 family)